MFETLVGYICCEIISADDIATGEAARMSDTRDWTECQDIFNHWWYWFNGRYETSNWNTLKRNATLRMVGPGSPPVVVGPSHFCYDYLNTYCNNSEAIVKFRISLATLELGCETPATVKHWT